MSEIKRITSECPMVIKCIPSKLTCPDCIARNVASSAEILGTIDPMDYEYEKGDLGWEEGNFPDNVRQYLIEKIKKIIEEERDKK